LCALALAGGCTAGAPQYCYSTPEQLASYHVAATQIEEPAVEGGSYLDHYGGAPPITIHDAAPKYIDLRLEEAVRLALQNSQVIRRLGVSVLDQPGRTPTRFEPAIQEM